mmetsp:Transcript_33659/g.95221  ORF Transcript_33659/g.95221 Transcript_33659/m.95221 type:complete len:241 (-) Transcript_33659:997-1719(-)
MRRTLWPAWGRPARSSSGCSRSASSPTPTASARRSWQCRCERWCWPGYPATSSPRQSQQRSTGGWRTLTLRRWPSFRGPWQRCGCRHPEYFLLWRQRGCHGHLNSPSRSWRTLPGPAAGCGRRRQSCWRPWPSKPRSTHRASRRRNWPWWLGRCRSCSTPTTTFLWPPFAMCFAARRSTPPTASPECCGLPPTYSTRRPSCWRRWPHRSLPGWTSSGRWSSPGSRGPSPRRGSMPRISSR